MTLLKIFLLILLVTSTGNASPWVTPDCYEAVMRGDNSCLNKPEPRDPSFKSSEGVETEEPGTCGQRFNTQVNIINGEDTVPGEFPWMAKLIYQNGAHCAGSLISRRHVVTAAHCVAVNNPSSQDSSSNIVVRLGDSDLSTEYDCLGRRCRKSGTRSCFSDGECAPRYIDMEVEDIIVHDNYKACDSNSDRICRTLPKYDVALIVLKQSVTISDFVQPVCLPTPGDDIHYINLVTLGWGNTAGEVGVIKPADVLQKLDLYKVELYNCNVEWKHHVNNGDSLLPSHICASSFEFGKSSCRGDSGGPLLRISDEVHDTWELAGIVSFGNGGVCGNVDLPLVFTRIAGEVNIWLRDYTGDMLPSPPAL